ncbi:MAG: M20/M25/M40 family metallo-hydrolase [Candidatus Korarchaeota archaeon]
MEIELLKKLIHSIGVSGYEELFYNAIEPHLHKLGFETRKDRSGNLVATRKGSGHPVSLIAHADTVGLIISHVSDNVAKFQTIGGIDLSCLPAHHVRIRRFATQDEVHGVIGFPPPHLTRDKVDLESLFIDVEEAVSVGDIAIFDEATVIQGGRIMSPYLDDRIGCFVSLEVARETDNDMKIVFTRGEEIGLQGAWSEMMNPEPERLKIVIDTSAAGDHPPIPPGKSTSSLGKGPIIRVHDIKYDMPMRLREWVEKIAKDMGVVYQIGVVGGTTDAAVVAQGSLNTVPICIPCRYSHSPVEMCSLKDVGNTIKLISELVKRW